MSQTIHIQAGNTEQITIYTITGQKLYEAEIQSGMNTVNASPFPQGILLIKCDSGWVKKLIIKLMISYRCGIIKNGQHEEADFNRRGLF